MFNYTWKAGVTSKSIVLRIIDATDGTPELGVVFNTSGIDLQYRREGAASVAITEVTLAALTTAYSSGGFLHIGNGYYRLDVPDAALAAGSDGVLIHGIVTGMVVIGCYVQLVAYDPFDVVRLGLTALPAAAAEAAGGLYTRGTGAGQINQPTNGRIDANVLSVAGTTQTARDLGASVLISSGTGAGQLNVTSGVVHANLVQILAAAITGTAAQLVAAFTKWFNVATPTGTVNSLPDAVPGAAGGVFIAGTNAATTITTALTTTFTGTLTGSVASVTGAVGSVTGNVGGNVTGSVGSVTGAVGSVAAGGITAASVATGAIDADALATDGVTEIADAVWNATRAGHVAGGSFGEGVASVQGNVVGNVTGNVVGNLNGTVGSLAAQAQTDVKTQVVAALVTDTYPEPGQGAPGVNISLKDKIGYVFKAFRNRITQTSTTLSIYNDDGSTVDHRATTTDDGTTYSRGEIISGP